MGKIKNIGKVMAGATIGAGLGVLFAPKSGKDTREDLKLKFGELTEKIKNIKSDEVKKEFNKRIKNLESELKELDKEKVLSVAKDKAKEIQKKANELVKLAKEKGDETVKKLSDDLRNKAIDVTKNVLDKLENNKKD